jgi:hypothetical protein
MSPSRPSLLSGSRIINSVFRRRTIHVCGLLATYDIEDIPTAQDDYWMAIDFVAIRELIGARDDMSVWICGSSIRRNRGFLLGDPACDRIVFDPLPFERLLSVEPATLAVKFLIEVTKKSEKLSAGETLVIVLVGHGEKDHSLLVGGEGRKNYEIRKDELEDCVSNAKGDVLVIITACYSGGWTSSCWTLLAATAPGEEAHSMIASDSAESRGGFFANALLAEHATEFSIRPPCPGAMDNRGFRHPQKEHDFGPEKAVRPVILKPRRCLQEVIDWIHKFRDEMERQYTTSVTFTPCREGPHRLPFVSLISASAPFHQLKCVPPSPNSNHASIRSASAPQQRSDSSPLQDIPEYDTQKLSDEEESELLDLSATLLRFPPPTIPSEKYFSGRCWMLTYGPARGLKPLSSSERYKLFFDLKNQIRKRDLALAIAQNLGWEGGVQKMGGGPGGKQTQLSPARALQDEAEASGCLVSILCIPTRYSPWGNAAGWLARVWEAEGRPDVSPQQWDVAVERGLDTLDG